MTAMMRIAKGIECWAAKVDFEVDKQTNLEDQEAIFDTKMNASGFNCHVVIEADEKREWLSLFVYPSITILEDRYSKVLSLMNDINNKIAVGRIAMNEKGVIQIKTVIDLEGCEITPKLIDNHFEALMHIVHTWMPEIAVMNYSKGSVDQVRRFLETAVNDSCETSGQEAVMPTLESNTIQ